MSNKYRSSLSKEILIYNIQYHILNDCNTKEECIDCVKAILETFEDKDNDREGK